MSCISSCLFYRNLYIMAGTVHSIVVSQFNPNACLVPNNNTENITVLYSITHTNPHLLINTTFQLATHKYFNRLIKIMNQYQICSVYRTYIDRLINTSTRAQIYVYGEANCFYCYWSYSLRMQKREANFVPGSHSQKLFTHSLLCCSLVTAHS